MKKLTIKSNLQKTKSSLHDHRYHEKKFKLTPSFLNKCNSNSADCPCHLSSLTSLPVSFPFRQTLHILLVPPHCYQSLFSFVAVTGANTIEENKQLNKLKKVNVVLALDVLASLRGRRLQFFLFFSFHKKKKRNYNLKKKR